MSFVLEAHLLGSCLSSELSVMIVLTFQKLFKILFMDSMKLGIKRSDHPFAPTQLSPLHGHTRCMSSLLMLCAELGLMKNTLKSNGHISCRQWLWSVEDWVLMFCGRRLWWYLPYCHVLVL